MAGAPTRKVRLMVIDARRTCRKGDDVVTMEFSTAERRLTIVITSTVAAAELQRFNVGNCGAVPLEPAFDKCDR